MDEEKIREKSTRLIGYIWAAFSIIIIVFRPPILILLLICAIPAAIVAFIVGYIVQVFSGKSKNAVRAAKLSKLNDSVFFTVFWLCLAVLMIANVLDWESNVAEFTAHPIIFCIISIWLGAPVFAMMIAFLYEEILRRFSSK